MAKVLYLSYDGITDPLGQSQIVPYAIKLARLGHSITLISFEKEGRQDRINRQRQSLNQAGLSWVPRHYHKRPAVLSTLWDLWIMYRTGLELFRNEKFEIIHARSYLPAIIGFYLRKKSDAKLVFDARGFWIDERIEGRIWNMRNPVFRLVASYLRQWEKRLFSSSDQIVLLTQQAKRLVTSGKPAKAEPDNIWVIPCCTDDLLFKPNRDEHIRVKWHARLNLQAHHKVVFYHGSWGSWYLTRELMRLMRVALEENKDFVLVVATPEPATLVLADAQAEGVRPEDIRVVSVTNREIAELLTVAEFAAFFIAPVFSKQASSPTKLGEIVCSAVPVITNAGIGDNDDLLAEESNVALVRSFAPEELRGAIRKMNTCKSDQYSESLRQFFSLDNGVRIYHQIYQKLLTR